MEYLEFIILFLIGCLCYILGIINIKNNKIFYSMFVLMIFISSLLAYKVHYLIFIKIFI